MSPTATGPEAEAGADEKSGEDSAAAAATPGAGDESDAAANADKGRALLHATGKALAALLTEFDQLPADTLRE